MEKYIGIKFSVDTFIHKPIKRYGRIRKELVKWSRILGDFTKTEGNEGNLSARIKNGFIITTANSILKFLTMDNLALVNKFDFKKYSLIKGMGLAYPSSETPLHFLIYKKRKDVNYIIHLHNLKLRKNIKITKKEFPYGTKELSREVVKTLGKEGIIIIKAHGILSVGRKIEDAVENIYKYKI